MSGTKYDDSKPSLALIPRVAIEAEGHAFGYGASKYGQWNYREGIEITRLVGAALRHIYAFLDGEDLDPESGYPHLGHARAGLAMALDTLKRKPEMDDRGVKVEESYEDIVNRVIRDRRKPSGAV